MLCPSALLAARRTDQSLITKVREQMRTNGRTRQKTPIFAAFIELIGCSLMARFRGTQLRADYEFWFVLEVFICAYVLAVHCRALAGGERGPI